MCAAEDPGCDRRQGLGGAQKEKERENTRMSYKLENYDVEKCDVKVDSKKEALEKNSADKLNLPKRPKLKAKKSKNVLPNNFKFIPLSKAFEMTERKPDLGGPDDRGSKHRDKRRVGAG